MGEIERKREKEGEAGRKRMRRMWSQKQLAGTCTGSEGFVNVKGRSAHTAPLHGQDGSSSLCQDLCFVFQSGRGYKVDENIVFDSGWMETKFPSPPLPLPSGAAIDSLAPYIPDQKANYHFPVGVTQKKNHPPHHQPPLGKMNDQDSSYPPSSPEPQPRTPPAIPFSS